MMKIYPYGSTMHHVTKLTREVTFPVSAEELRCKFAGAKICVDYDGTAVSFESMLDRAGVEWFETAAAYISALNSIV